MRFMKKLTEIENLLVKLININSTSGQEAAVAGFIESKLGGFKLKRQHVSKNRFNIIAKKGKTDLWLVAHMDTVPPFFKAKVGADKIWGRGAVDNKGNIAGVLIAARELKDINILFTVGEEQDFIGARKTKIKGRAIIFEPTVFKVRTAQCGVIAAKLTAKGDQKHSSLIATKKDNAVHVLVETLNFLTNQKWNCFNIGVIKGGVAPNVVAGSAEADFSVRPKSREEFLKILKVIKALQGVSAQIINKMPPSKSRLAKMFPTSEPVSFFSELFFFERGILFGVGDIAEAHTPTEFVNRKDLNALPGKILSLAKSLSVK